jgi:hypothetical protein
MESGRNKSHGKEEMLVDAEVEGKHSVVVEV